MKCAVQVAFLHQVARDTFLLNFYVSSGNLKFQAVTLLERCLAENKASCLANFHASFTLSANKARAFSS